MADVISATSSSTLYKAKLLDYFYTRRAESAIGKGTRFKIASACWGASSLVSVNSAGGWDIAFIPSTFTIDDMKTKFATGSVIASVQDDVITLNAVLPQDQLSENTVYDFNTLVLLDSDGKAIAVLAKQQDTVYVGKSYSIIMTIEQSGS